jgi:restriction system protein
MEWTVLAKGNDYANMPAMSILAAAAANSMHALFDKILPVFIFIAVGSIVRRKDRFQNPLCQNYKHVKTLAELTGIPENFFISIVVFAGDCKFKTTMPPNVVRLGYFADFIKSRTERLIKDEQVPKVVSAIREWAGTVSDDLKKQHVSNLKKNKAPVSAESEAPSCPRCSSPMVLRNRRQGGQFWGCPKYPACRGIREAS